MNAQRRQQVRNRAKDRCEYCRLPQAAMPFAPFHIEHIVAQQHGGSDDDSNLALACDRCNAFKGPNLTAIDPQSQQVVALYNPRTQIWSAHFRQIEYEIEGLTDTGRAAVRLLNMNARRRVQMRAMLGLLPIPDSPDDLKAALTQAADGEPKWAKWLLDAGADPNGIPLIMAIQCDQPDIVQLMIDAGADVNQDYVYDHYAADGSLFSSARTTPLVHAVGGTHSEIVKRLVDAGADVNKRAPDGITPIQAAETRGRTNATPHERNAILSFLKSAGAVE